MSPNQHLPKLVVAIVAMDYMMEVKVNNESRLELSEFGEARFLKELVSALGFDYDLQLSKDGEYGRLTSNGSWTGLVGMLQRDKVDLVCCGLMMTEHRAKDVDFTTTYSGTSLTFAIGMAGESYSKNAYLEPFYGTVWGCFLGILIVVAIVIRLEGRHSFGKILFGLVGSILRQPVSILDGNSRKLILVLWMVYTLVISSCYSGSLLSFLTVPDRGKNVETFQELANAVEKATHRCYVQRGTNTASYLKGTEAKYLQALGKAIESNDWYYDTSDMGKHKIIPYDSAEITYEKELRFFYGTRASEVFISSDAISSVSIAIALNRNFCCRAKLNKVISTFTNAGLVEKYIGDASFRYWLASSRNTKPRVSKKKQLTLKGISGALILLFAGYFISFLTLLGEISAFKFHVNS